jgi:hypothetical protein
MADVTLKPIRWLWPDRIAIGKLSLIAGHPDLGKSLVTLDLAARVTTGAPWPVNGGRAPLGNVVLLSAEDDPEDTYGPRLKAMGADLSRIDSITMVKILDPNGKGYRSFDLQQDLDRLEIVVKKKNAIFVGIDPISAYMGKPGKIDTHRNTDVRAILHPLKEMAERTQSAVLLISHLTKSGGTEALQRVTGSGAFIAAARAGFMVERDESDGAAPGRRLVLPIKANLTSVRSGFAYRIEGQNLDGLGVQPIIVWEDRLVEVTADQALAAKDRTRRSKPNPVVNFLREFLSAGPRAMKNALEEALARGYSAKQLRDAREKIGVVPYRDPPNDARAPWYWKLPDPADTPF